MVVVLADDNDVNRAMLAETLELFGAVVWPAESGEEAIRMVAEHHPDIVLMDCQMPGMDGLEATRRIRATEGGEQLPIIAVTAFATSTYRDQCLAPGMMDRFMSKPLNTPDLFASIRQLTTREGAPAGAGASASANRTSVAEGTLAGRILLVDDNPPILESTRAMLARLGCSVNTASDGQNALDQLKRVSSRTRPTRNSTSS